MMDATNCQPNGTGSRRRLLKCGLTLVALGMLAGCGIPSPQVQPSPPRMPLVAMLAGVAPPTPRVDAVQRGLRELGYVEGQNVIFEYRYAEGKEERLSQLAAELVALNPQVIVTINSAAIRPVKNATSTIPLVMVADNADPVAVGYIASLAHPGGNVTGLTGLSPAVTQKRLQLLKEAVPGLSRVGMLRNPSSQDRDVLWSETEAAAGTLGLNLRALDVRSADEIESAFDLAVREHVEAIVVVRDPLVTTSRKRIAELAARHRLPAMYASPEFVEVGGLMTYGSDTIEMYRRTAVYVDKILRGAKPADLPVEQAEHFGFVINLKAAHDLGLTIPESVLLRATQVVQ
jgi:putative ABC transport system substrate-binding protein